MTTPHTRRLKRNKRRQVAKRAGRKLTPPEKKRNTPGWVRFDKRWYRYPSESLMRAELARDQRQRDKDTNK